MPTIDLDLERKLASFNQVCFAISSARDPDMPIIFASSSFYELTGYSQEEVLGKNCRFLHGPGTSRQKVMEIRDAIQEDRSVQVCILNYKKNGESFWNHFYLEPIFDDSGVVEYYIGVQADVTEEVDAARLSRASMAEDGPLVLTEEPTCDDVAKAEERAAGRLKSLLKQWDTSRPGQSLVHHVSGPVAAPCLPTSLLQPLMKLAQSFVLANPEEPDCPIVYASQRFLDLTGYPRDRVVGHNCRFLQGPGTDPESVRQLREGIKAGGPVTVKLLNYKYDGTPFWNHLHISAVRNASGKVVFLVGVQLDITAPQTIPEEAEASAAGAPDQAAPDQAVSVQAAEPSGRALVAQRGVCGAVRVACRSLCPADGLRRSIDDQAMLRRSQDFAARRSTDVCRVPPPSAKAVA
ncbi:g5924 [Coccomyxa elongata]